MQGPQKAVAPSPQQVQQPAHATTTASPAHTADSVVSYVMQTTEVSPQINSEFWEKGLTATGAVLAVLIPLFVKWRMDAKKRKFDVKRTLYLKVADAIHEGGAIFGAFGSVETTLKELVDRFSKALAHVSKAEMVAGDDLLRALTKLKNQAGQDFGTFSIVRMKLEKHTADINAIAPILQKLQADSEWANEELRRINVEGLFDLAGQQRFQRVQTQFDMTQQQRQQFLDQLAVAHADRQKVIVQLGEMAAKFVSDMIPLRADLLLCMRKELDFDFNVDEYRSLQLDMAQKAAATLAETVKAAEETFKVGEQSKPEAPKAEAPAQPKQDEPPR